MSDTYIWKLTMAKGRAEMFAREIAKGLFVGEHFKGMSEDRQAERIAALERENAELRAALEAVVYQEDRTLGHDYLIHAATMEKAKAALAAK